MKNLVQEDIGSILAARALVLAALNNPNPKTAISEETRLNWENTVRNLEMHLAARPLELISYIDEMND